MSKQPQNHVQHRRIKTLPNQQVNTIQFSPATYKSSDDPQAYIESLLMKNCQRNKISHQKMSIKQLGIILNEMGVAVKNVQLHEVYLYATYDGNVKSQRKVDSVVNIESNKINIVSVAKWLHRRLQKNKLELSTDEFKKVKKHTHAQSCEISTPKLNLPSTTKLPVIKTRPVNIFAHEVGQALDIFSQMQKQRQNAGLEPVCISSDEQVDHNLPTKQIYYEGDFFEVNQKLSQLKSQAHKRIQKIIQATKYDKKLKRKFEQALMRYEKVRSQANQKIGRCGAMKAQKRMNDKQKHQIKLLQRWRQKTNQTQFQTKYY